MAGSGGELAKRVGVALVGIPLTAFLAYLGGYWLASLVAIIAAAAGWEFGRMHVRRGVPAAPWVSGWLALLYVLMAVAIPPGRFVIWAVVLTLAVLAGESIRRPAAAQPGLATVTTAFGAVYTGLLLAFVVWLRALDPLAGTRGAAIVFFPVAITWLGDTAAYFIGKGLGRRPFAPTISPKKTWEGAIAGLVATAAGAVLWLELTDSIVGWTMSVGAAIGFGALVSAAGQAGDLFESRFKRECGVKDSSNLIPGHGGFLDRVDSLLFAFPVTYAYLILVGV
ncbi:MAG: phosphatidate cytidylyltransferase [Gemmatimonadetes bacterium]|uniref:Phosphatidate cytidylyltransferase n=1 Tax=Candidatus Kutchimonas denitrificans TaxID=3056748 RepID=A0AAE4Z9F2_9BACT|nr:phosphatidate cytidylyltransferase [Gemmatimonadota bacterium]NIR76239.1 phosphatidate cytidylyltransferase [Candidatus Kutchimonas denitrificans]NIS00679.1 phosphatidate cytidylyltransferase [Gemmatimonadota bacterium]NIT66824.1 phosphatidate cytidylyltransferase [Gemmatimonadota bacterium]NIV23423.1 phosphatidate cytidylyltransferase [Gemmatimonadota bacterium]